jgi:hypothetical protein
VSFITCLDSSTELSLSYALVTYPAPLNVSLSAKTNYADIQLVITNQRTDTVENVSISVTVAIGPDAASLSDETTQALGWEVQPADPWTVTPPSQPGVGDNVYTLTASDSGTGELAGGDSIVLTFTSVPINEALGTTVLSVVEKTSSGGGATSYALSKFPYGFSFRNLRVTDPQNEDVMLSQVPHGGTVRLLWDGSVTDVDAYSVLYSTASGPASGTLTAVNQWDSPQLVGDTIFNVVVTVNDRSGQSVTHSLTTSVAVTKPDLSVGSIDLAGQDLASELAAIAKFLVPTGTIAMWSGSATAVPTGWALCDGTNGTPNLVNQFILGAGSGGSDPQPGATGGSGSHGHGASATVSLGAVSDHTHGVPAGWKNNWAWPPDPDGGTSITVVDRNAQDVPSAQTQSAGSHTHDASGSSVNVDTTTALPPYYALCFIVKQA